MPILLMFILGVLFVVFDSALVPLSNGSAKNFYLFILKAN